MMISKRWLSPVKSARHKNKPVKAFIHPWDWPTNSFDRIHVDCFSLYGLDYYLLAHSYSKWIEIEVMKNTRTHTTIVTLRKWFARFGVRVQLVSDNGPQLGSSEFSQFLQMNGIKHIRCSVYQPCSNGGAERFVQTGTKGHVISKQATRLRNWIIFYWLTALHHPRLLG